MSIYELGVFAKKVWDFQINKKLMKFKKGEEDILP